MNVLISLKKFFYKFFFQRNFIDIVLFGVVVVLFFGLMAGASEKLGYYWQWYRVDQFIFTFTEDGFRMGPLLLGLGVTLKITGVSLALSFIFGLAAAVCRLSNSFSAVLLARIYTESIRNTPLIVQLFFIYFVLGPILGIDRFTAAILSLSLFEGAYASEIFRSGILSVHSGQWEASFALGFTRGQAYRYVILPQAIRNILPPLTGQAVSLIKDSALVSTISVYDLTMRGQSIISETYMTFELWFTIAAIYLVLTLSLSFAANRMGKRSRRGLQRKA